MTSQDELRDRIKKVLSDHYIEATGPGEVSCRCEHEWRPTYSYRNHLAQAIIDDLGLEIETQSLRWMDPNGPFPQTRVVGRWESVE